MARCRQQQSQCGEVPHLSKDRLASGERRTTRHGALTFGLGSAARARCGARRPGARPHWQAGPGHVRGSRRGCESTGLLEREDAAAAVSGRVPIGLSRHSLGAPDRGCHPAWRDRLPAGPELVSRARRCRVVPAAGAPPGSCSKRPGVGPEHMRRQALKRRSIPRPCPPQRVSLGPGAPFSCPHLVASSVWRSARGMAPEHALWGLAWNMCSEVAPFRNLALAAGAPGEASCHSACGRGPRTHARGRARNMCASGPLRTCARGGPAEHVSPSGGATLHVRRRLDICPRHPPGHVFGPLPRACAATGRPIRLRGRFQDSPRSLGRAQLDSPLPCGCGRGAPPGDTC